VEVFKDILNNNILGICIMAYLVAQFLKVIIVFIDQKKLDFRRFVGAGGMPSSHTSFVVALATSIGMVEGFASNSFAICLCFALVVMYDASGVRRAVGEQARILNKIVESFNKHTKPESEEVAKQLKELLGHTPFQVVVGAIVGFATAMFLL
jgi:acid phosphatase family membrane protein YuiD